MNPDPRIALFSDHVCPIFQVSLKSCVPWNLWVTSLTYSIRHSLKRSWLCLRHVFGNGEEVTLQETQQSGGPFVLAVNAGPEGRIVEAGHVAQRYHQLLQTNQAPDEKQGTENHINLSTQTGSLGRKYLRVPGTKLATLSRLVSLNRCNLWTDATY